MEKLKELKTKAFCVVLVLLVGIGLVTKYFWDKPVRYFDDLVKAEQTCMIKNFGREPFVHIHEEAKKLYMETVVDSNNYKRLSSWFRPTEKEAKNPKALKDSFNWYKGWELILDTSMRLFYILLLRWEVFVISLLIASAALVVSMFRGYRMRGIIRSNRNYPDYPLHKWVLKVRPYLKWLLIAWFFIPSFPFYYLGFLLILLAMCYSAGVSMAYLYKKQ